MIATAAGVAVPVDPVLGIRKRPRSRTLDDLTSRGLAGPDLVIVDGGKGLEAALASLWDDVPVEGS